MQASELHSLIQKLEDNQSAHYNIVADTMIDKQYYFSAPGETYYNIIKDLRTGKYIVEYHTATHIYTLNNVWLNTTQSQHNQYRTILGASNIPVVTCEAHEEVTFNEIDWIYNAFSKPITNSKSTIGFFGELDRTVADAFNNYILAAVSTLNCLAEQPLGSKVWPLSQEFVYGPESYYRNDESNWYWKSPLAYTNQQSIDPNKYAYEIIQTRDKAVTTLDISLNPESGVASTNVYSTYLQDLNDNVFGVAKGEI